MHKRLALVAAAALVALPGQRAEAAYTSSDAWASQLQAGPSQALVPFPSYTLVTQDAFGTTAPRQVNTSGQLSGNYGCNSAINPCSGAYRLTYTLPFDIVGFGGDLELRQVQTDFRPPLDVPLTRTLEGRAYSGFYGDLFSPTNTITITWLPGLLSTDDFGSFTLRSAQVVPAPVPEPASALALAGALLLAGWFRGLRPCPRRSAGGQP